MSLDRHHSYSDKVKVFIKILHCLMGFNSQLNKVNNPGRRPIWWHACVLRASWASVAKLTSGSQQNMEESADRSEAPFTPEQTAALQGIIEAAISRFAERQPVRATSTVPTDSETVAPPTSASSASLPASGGKRVRGSHSS